MMQKFIIHIMVILSALAMSCTASKGGRSRSPIGTPQQNPLGQAPALPPNQYTQSCLEASEDLCAIERLITAFTNDYRAQSGVAPLKQDLRVSLVARKWSQQQAAQGSIGHSGFPSARTASYVTAFGTQPDIGFYAENVAMTYGEGIEEVAKSLATMWYQSYGHRVNMMDSSYGTLGIGVYTNPNTGEYYATQIFGQ